MSTPKNQLDDFTTYTYHFQLLAAHNWDDLSLAQNTDAVVSTTSTRGTKIKGTGTTTVLIDTRADAHQTIEDVIFDYVGSSTNHQGHFIPDGSMKFKVIEPNKIFFLQKIRKFYFTFKMLRNLCLKIASALRSKITNGYL